MYIKKTGRDSNINYSNLVNIINLLNENDIEYCIFYGTLLGLYRDGKIIENDDDIDFLIDKKYYDKLKNIMNDHYQLSSYDAREIFFQYINTENNSLIDFYFFEERDDFLIEKWNIGYPLSNWVLYNKKDIYPLDILEINGLKVKVPNNIENVLTFIYGEKYKIPLDKNTDYKMYVENNKFVIKYKN